MACNFTEFWFFGQKLIIDRMIIHLVLSQSIQFSHEGIEGKRDRSYIQRAFTSGFHIRDSMSDSFFAFACRHKLFECVGERLYCMCVD